MVHYNKTILDNFLWFKKNNKLTLIGNLKYASIFRPYIVIFKIDNSRHLGMAVCCSFLLNSEIDLGLY